MDRPRTPYDYAKDGLTELLGDLNLKIVHQNDGSPIGDKCLGFFLALLYERASSWKTAYEMDKAGL